MTTRERFGDLPLRDYVKMTRTRPPWRRTRALVTAGACVLAFAAGRFGPWGGHDSHRLTLNDALEIIDSKHQADWANELASAAIARHVVSSLDALQRLATSGVDSQARTDAAIYLGTLATAASERFVLIAQDPKHQGKWVPELEALRKAVLK